MKRSEKHLFAPFFFLVCVGGEEEDNKKKKKVHFVIISFSYHPSESPLMRTSDSLINVNKNLYSSRNSVHLHLCSYWEG